MKHYDLATYLHQRHKSDYKSNRRAKKDHYADSDTLHTDAPIHRAA